MDNYVVLVLIMVLSGVLGGTVNYFSIDTESKRKVLKFIDYNLLKSIFTGIVASLLVPLFLNMISSNIIEETNAKPDKLFIFGGFCLIAAISSKTFIQTLSSKVVQQLNEVKKEVTTVKKDIDPLIQQQTEPDNINENKIDISLKSMIDMKDSKLSEAFKEADTDNTKVLKTFILSQYTYRSTSGLAKDTGLDSAKVKKILDELMLKDYVAQISTDKGPKFYITSKGRDELTSFI